jgi:hypothetical protein
VSATTVPLPTWRTLMTALVGRRPDPAALAAPWARGGNRVMWFSRSAWSLAALAETFADLLGGPAVVAVPEYICNGALAPLARRASLLFYPVSAETLAPDWEGCAALPRFDLFLLPHYFGYPSDAATAADFCADRHAVLVEDAAHVLRPLPGVGEAGAITLYSPHKLLAVPDGAALVVAEGGEDLIEPLARIGAGLGAGSPPALSWALRRAVQKTPLGTLQRRFRPGGQPDFAADPGPEMLPPTPASSRAGAALIAAADLATIAARRAANARLLADALTPLAAWMPLFAERDDVAPYRLAMRCRDEDVAADLYARLRRAGVPVESWPDLPPGLAPDSAALLLRGTVLLLACHQGIRAERMAAAATRAIGAGR